MAKRKRKQLGENNVSIEAIARDAEKEGRHADARRIRQEMTAYRHLPATKFPLRGKAKPYKNLRQFNRECSIRGNGKDAMYCELKAVRCLADGSGVASVYVRGYGGSDSPRSMRLGGTWRLHFADCGILKKHLSRRVDGELDMIKTGRIK